MADIVTDIAKIDELLTRGVVEVISAQSLKKKLTSGKQLRVKLGIDPTGPRIHIGRSITLLKLKDFQDLGHQVVFIIGDFTAQVGDTSDKNSERPMLTVDQIKENMTNYLQQVGQILDLSKLEVHFNSEWLEKLNFVEIAKMADAFSVHEFTEREVIKRRINAGKRVNMREMLYPIMQGYDSVAIKADVEIGGTDQRFNMLAGRILTEQANMPKQDILMTDIINGTDGEKMSTSKGNTIFINNEPNELYGAVMSITDEMIIPYLTMLTRIPQKEINQHKKDLKGNKNPKVVKEILATELVRMYYSDSDAKKAAKEFSKIFAKKGQPSQMEAVKIKPGEYSVVDLLTTTKLAGSKSEAKRLVDQGGVRIDDNVVNEAGLAVGVHEGMVINVGKRKWVKISLR